MSHVTEAIRQMMGRGGGRQVKDARARLRQRQRRNHERAGEPDPGAAVMSEYVKPLPKPHRTSRPFWEAAQTARIDAAAMRRVQRVTSIIRATDARNACRISFHGSASADAARSTATPSCAAPRRVHSPTSRTCSRSSNSTRAPRMTTNIDRAAGSVKVGMPVTVWFDDVTPEQTLVKFKPA